MDETMVERLPGEDDDAERKWLVRPYEAAEWRLTSIEPTEELRRFMEFKAAPICQSTLNNDRQGSYTRRMA